MKTKCVAIALSGGVDSTVAAFVLKQKGYDLIGLHMLIREPDQDNGVKISNADIGEIKRLCVDLGVPFYVLDMRSEFECHVISYFCTQYASGFTPNPCVVCNRYIKFGVLLQKALSLGADFMATGHYANIRYFNRSYHLLKGVDRLKDQSYLLYRLNQDQLSRILLPLGGYKRSEVIDIAKSQKFTAVQRKSSQDICFIDRKYTDFLLKYLQPQAGEIVDRYGNILGLHKGIIFYTIGQRYGLGISSHHRLYVTGIDSVTNRIIVGSENETYHSELLAKDVNWIAEKPPKGRRGIKVKIRYKSASPEVNLELKDKYIRVQFKHPQKSITPGQSVVFYKADEVLGGGIIDAYAK